MNVNNSFAKRINIHFMFESFWLVITNRYTAVFVPWKVCFARLILKFNNAYKC